MLKLITDQKFILWFFAVSFVAIQPSKIIAAMTGMKSITGQFLFPLVLYFALLVMTKKSSTILLHTKVLLVQFLIAGFHLCVANLYHNNYLLFFFITPHLCLFSMHLFEQFPEDHIISRSLSAYICLSLIASIISIHFSKIDIGPDTFLSLLGDNFFSRVDSENRHRILLGINYGQYIFDLPRSILEGVALTVYPLLLFSLCFLKTNLLKDKFILLGLAASSSYIIFKNSRGEILFLLLLLGYPLAKKIFTYVRWTSLLIIAFGYLQLFIGKQALNGRNSLNDLFIDNISVLGSGIGFSTEKILQLTNNDYSSIHNIHFDIITNFGVLIYLIFIAFTIWYILSGEYNRNKHYYLCLFFVLFATNFEIFDLYFALPLGIVASEIIKNPNFNLKSTIKLSLSTS